MANIVRVRVELKRKYNDPAKNEREMIHEFKRRVSNAGIMHKFKEHQYYESKSEKARKKRKDAAKRFQLEMLAEKFLAGERIKAPSNVIKKIQSEQSKKDR